MINDQGAQGYQSAEFGQPLQGARVYVSVHVLMTSNKARKNMSISPGQGLELQGTLKTIKVVVC